MSAPVFLDPVSGTRTHALLALRHILDAAETVDSYTTDYTRSADGARNILVADSEFIRSEKVGDVLRVLAELDGVAGSDLYADPSTAHGALFIETQERAGLLAAAIRECLAPTPMPVEVDEVEAPSAPRAAHTHTGFEVGAL
jgi:hypothetical protein